MPPVGISEDCSGPVDAEVIEVGFHVAKSEMDATASNPFIYDFRNGVKAFSMTALLSGMEATADEQVAMDQFVQEGREEQSTIVARVT